MFLKLLFSQIYTPGKEMLEIDTEVGVIAVDGEGGVVGVEEIEETGEEAVIATVVVVVGVLTDEEMREGGEGYLKTFHQGLLLSLSPAKHGFYYHSNLI